MAQFSSVGTARRPTRTIWRKPRLSSWVSGGESHIISTGADAEAATPTSPVSSTASIVADDRQIERQPTDRRPNTEVLLVLNA
uniref:Uncharacterized protein n=1 Tax=Leersia perrieri TaxID=77586 RepID=A0A0D9XAF5_9ORYZ